LSPKLDAVTLVAVSNSEEGIAALESGAVDGYASDKLLLVVCRQPIFTLCGKIRELGYSAGVPIG
jgi:hypothetical protein